MQAGGQEARLREARGKAMATAKLSCNQRLASRVGKESGAKLLSRPWKVAER